MGSSAWCELKIQIVALTLTICELGKHLGFSKHLTAEELHKLVIQKKATYEEIRRMEPNKFMDLEATMRMLYDHGNMKFDSS